jgi:hypothetical protein
VHAPCCIIICLSLSTIFFYVTSSTAHFSENKLLNLNLCSDFFYNVCPRDFSFLKRTERELSEMYIGLHVQYLSDFNKCLIFAIDFRILLLSNFMRVRPASAGSFHADGWTDMTKLIVAYRNFATAPKN